MRLCLSGPLRTAAVLLFSFGLAGAVCAAGASSDVSSSPPLGETGAVTALPDVPTPPTRPCVVPLFSDVQFANFTPKTFDYAPPARCRGPWARVVLVMDWSVTAGRQFDRTASLWLGGVNVYFGTTQEPSSNISPHWQIQRDLTDYSALLRQPQSGRTILGNVVNGTYTGVIHGSAKLVFYPGPAPRVPDMIVPLSSNPDGDTMSVSPGTPQVGRTLDLPRNMVAIYMDVYAQSQASDEFWQFCVPDAVADKLSSCGGSGFRQTMVYIDGQPAGVAPVYPWIYTGGVSPALWRPIPGVQTLDFRPFRVNLTPFAAQLDDGQPHAVTLGVTNTGNHFSMAANLLIYRDPARKVVTGALTRNTLEADPAQQDDIETLSDTQTRVSTTSTRDFSVAGYVMTSRGRVDTQVHQKVDFSSVQDFTISDTQFRQTLDQHTKVHVTTRVGGLGPAHVTTREIAFPLYFDYNDYVGSDGLERLAMQVDQSFDRTRRSQQGRRVVFSDHLHNEVTPSVQYNFDASGNLASVSPWTGAQHVHYDNSLGQCFDRRLTSDTYDLLDVTDGEGCGGHNRYRWTPLMNLGGGFFTIGNEDALWRW
ncbi:hypothetical protein GCM10027285_02900 [Oleiagrimonas citrea]|uniref:Peptide-N(4)-(N-acetyl-beta-glucosaminyl)asparagine amidase n=1 Tax=Oleiagrimonas citrea TaxID=1665687 RepID=A0A846ZPG3_9GAMM|nr:peptide-N4-asparagine amidase [Oleiagrimonas citrea]NKZ39331.1 peptide-N(4)-(N-acetyl-beta-glucosaminyl)asparagine amidase [Oleiagrimonas citrea]